MIPLIQLTHNGQDLWLRLDRIESVRADPRKGAIVCMFTGDKFKVMETVTQIHAKMNVVLNELARMGAMR